MPGTTTTAKKAVTTENLTALKPILATNASVDKKIEDAQLAGSAMEFATDEEVLALFQDADTEPAE